MTVRIISLSLLLILGGCASQMQPAPSVAPACRALIGPIRYNTYKLHSPRHAGHLLAKDLKRRNQVWTRLHCR